MPSPPTSSEPKATSREFKEGVAHADRLWQQMLPKLIEEAKLHVDCLQCTRCGARYELLPENTEATTILCPNCLNQKSEAIGTCRKVKHSVWMTSAEYMRLIGIVSNLKEAADQLIEQIQKESRYKALQKSSALLQLVAEVKATEEHKAFDWKSLAFELTEMSTHETVTVPLERYKFAETQLA